MSYIIALIIGSAGQLVDRILDKWLGKFLLMLASFGVPVFVVLWHLPFAFIGVWMAVLGLKHKEPKTSTLDVTQKLEAHIRASPSRWLRFSFHGAPRTYMIIGGILIAVLDIGRNGTVALSYATDARRQIKNVRESELDLKMKKLTPGERAIMRSVLRDAREPQPSPSIIPTPDQSRPSP